MPPKPPNPKSKRNRNMLIGAAAVGLLLLLYLRSRSAGSANATSPTDIQNAAAQAAQSQAQQDAQLYGSNTPSTFADNGANAGALGDAVTTGLQGINDALAQQAQAFQTWQQQQQQGGGTTTAPGASAPVTITINGTGQPAGGAPTSAGVSQPTPKNFASLDKPFLAPGAKAPNYALVKPKGAPQNARWSGAKSPGKGWAGIGGGWWKPVK